MTSVIILSIGDELVLGQTVDTNSAWLSSRLSALGLRVVAHLTVADDRLAIAEAVRAAAARCDVLLISGGLGPTEDDLTRQALSDVLGQPLLTNDQALVQLRAFFSRLGRPMPITNEIQAMIPRGVVMIENTCGTAPGIDANYQLPGRSCRIFVMPGVPREMEVMFTRDIVAHLRHLGGGAAIVSCTLHTFGLGESSVAEKLGNLMDRRRNPSVGTTVSGGVVSLRVNSYFQSPAKAQEELAKTVALCHQVIGDLIYGQDDQTLVGVVAAMLPEQGGSGASLCTAESCTGGLLAKMLTDIPGSSAYFLRGYVTYSNQAKTELLGVPAQMIQRHGAVSEPVADAMARGALASSGANFALSITGIAGPDGGTPDKPVGTVCIGLAFRSRVSRQEDVSVCVRTFRFSGDRQGIRQRSANMALAMLRYHLLGKEMPF